MEKEVKVVYDKYKKLLSDCDKECLNANEDLLRNIAFTVVVLDKLQKETLEKGVTENFEQGSQKFVRHSTALKTYNTTINSFVKLVDRVNALLPKTDTKLPEGEKLLQYLASDSE